MLHTVLCQSAGQAGKEDQRALACRQDLATSCQVSMAGQKEDQIAVLDVKIVNNLMFWHSPPLPEPHCADKS